MKRIIAVVLAVIFLTTSVMAGEIRVTLNGNDIEFSSQRPVIIEGRTYVPLRGVFERLGYSISWDGLTKTAEFRNSINRIKIVIGEKAFNLNGQEKIMETPARIINGSIMMPLKDVCGAMGFEVSWNPEEKIVNIEDDGTADALLSGDVISSLDKISTLLLTDYMFVTLNEKFDYIKKSNDMLINESLEGEFSVEETIRFYNRMINCCDSFKHIAARVKNIDLSEAVSDFFIDYVETLKEYYVFKKEYICTNKYDDYGKAEIQQMLDEYENAAIEAINGYYGAVNALSYSILLMQQNLTYSRYFYNIYDLSEEERETLNAYRKEISAGVIEALSFCKDEAAVYESENYRNAADKIREKLNGTEAPDICMLDKQAMLKTCDLLEKTADDIEHGFDADNVMEEYNIEFTSMFTVIGLMFSSTLGEYFNTDMIFGSGTVAA